MGVAGLWPIMRPAGEHRSLVHLTVVDGFEENLHGKRAYRIGIDCSIWFFHAEHGREGENPELRTLFFRLARLLALPILPLFVFDGPNRPKFKRGKRIAGHKESWMVSGMKQIINAYGFEHHTAPGEAEAELAYLNQIGVIDAIISDDVDNFLFGAEVVIRNPSATLTGNNAHPKKNSAGKVDDMHVMIYTAKAIKEHPDVQLTQGGCILIGIMSGGDYIVEGLRKCGPKISHGLARGGFGDRLVELYHKNKNSDTRLANALDEWRESLRLYLRTDPDRYIGRREVALSKSIPNSFPDTEVLKSYIEPVTSATTGNIPNIEWRREPCLGKLANVCELYFEWGVKPLIIKRFRTVIWRGAVMRILRRAAMDGDEKEMITTNDLQSTPRKAGRRPKEFATGTPSKRVKEYLTREPTSPTAGYKLSSREDDENPLLVKIHQSRTHASTDGLLEYRLEVDPAQLVEMTEAGIQGLKDESSIDIERFGFGSDGEAGDDVEEGDQGKKKGRNPKAFIDPATHLRVWLPASMVNMVEPTLIEEFELIRDGKEAKKLAKEERARAKAEGRPLPKAIRASKPSTNAPKPSKSSTTSSQQGPPESSPKQKKVKLTTRKFVADHSSDDDAITPKRNPFKIPSVPNKKSAVEVSDTDYMSTSSVHSKSGPSVPKETSSFPYKFLFTQSSQPVQGLEDSDDDLDPYAALVNYKTPAQSRTTSGSSITKAQETLVRASGVDHAKKPSFGKSKVADAAPRDIDDIFRGATSENRTGSREAGKRSLSDRRAIFSSTDDGDSMMAIRKSQKSSEAIRPKAAVTTASRLSSFGFKDVARTGNKDKGKQLVRGTNVPPTKPPEIIELSDSSGDERPVVAKAKQARSSRPTQQTTPAEIIDLD